MGSIYGMWEKDLFKNLEMVGNENFDYLYVIASSLEKGFIFFESEENLFGLRLVIKKSNDNFGNHATLCPRNIFSPKIYFTTSFYRFYISILQIIKNSCLSNEGKVSCILSFENSLKGKNNLRGTPYLGIRLLIKELIRLLTFKTNLHEFLFLLSYSIYASYLKNKTLKLLINKN